MHVPSEFIVVMLACAFLNTFAAGYMANNGTAVPTAFDGRTTVKNKTVEPTGVDGHEAKYMVYNETGVPTGFDGRVTVKSDGM